MPLINPNTSQSPLWRFPTRKLEYPITAYRGWLLDIQCDPVMLTSVAASYKWEGPVAKSDVPPLDPRVWRDQPNVAAHSIHTAGLWAVKDQEQLNQVIRTYRPDVVGEVHLYGRVGEFELGYRAEYCMIRKLWLRSVSWHPGLIGRPTWQRMLVKMDSLLPNKVLANIIDSLEQRYQCDVEQYKGSIS